MSLKRFLTSKTAVYSVFAFIIAILYYNTISFGYVNDDYVLVNITSYSKLHQFLFYNMHFRPFWYGSYFLTNALFQSSYFDHFINVFLYFFVTILCFHLANVLLKSKLKAFYCSIIWIFLPWNAFPTTWISQRSDLLIYSFGFPALFFFFKQKYNLSTITIIPAVLSKVTVILLPLFFVYKYAREKHYKQSIALLLLSILILLISVYNLSKFGAADGHIAGLPLYLRMVNHLSHLVEGVITLFIPFPFFHNIPHFVVYLVSLAGLLLLLEWNLKKINVNVVIIFLLTLLPGAVNPELRVLGFAGLFLLLGILSIVRMRPRLRVITNLLLVLVLCSHAVSIHYTKTNFKTNHHEPGVSKTTDDLYYPNSYYRVKRQKLVEIKNWLLGP